MMEIALRKYLFLLFCLASYTINQSQAIINYSNATDAVSFLTSGNLNPLNPNFIGGAQQLGVVDASNTNLGIDFGIILATGDCQMSSNSPGNSDDSSSEGFLLSGSDPDLEIISNTTVFDAAVLEFDFIATSTNANIQFVFASEEYNEYVCGAVNDAFGIFISGPGYNGSYSNGAENIANIPGTTTPVSINTVNNGNVGQAGILSDCLNSFPDWDQYTNYFIDNSTLSTNPNTIEYDGFTVPITVDIPLICGEMYHLKIAIGDGGDPVYDSAVFLLAEGFSPAQANLISTDSLQLCYGDQIQLSTQSLGPVSWSPSLGLDDPTSPTPMASPSSDTWYYASSDACGSMITDSIYVDVGDIIETVNFVTICEGESYIEGNSVYTNFGMYEDIYSSSGGCDSIVTTLLSVSPIVEVTNVVSVCQGESYIEGNSIYTQPGFYQDSYQNQNGCDSIVNTILSYISSPTTNIDASICFGDSYNLGANSFSQSGNYSEIYQAVNGCDSTVNLNLTVLPEIAMSLTAEICEGEFFNFGNETYTQSGSYAQYYTASNGCDSTIYISLFVNPSIQVTNNVEICTGSSYTEGNSSYDQAGTYYDYYTSMTGCDSVVTTVLELSDYLSSTNYISICEGESYQEGSSNYTQAGSYEDWYLTQNCDSVVYTVLSVVPSSEMSQEINICQGESYSIGNSTYTQSGSYSDLFQNSLGCDSLVNTILNVNTVFEINNDISICEGESYTVGNSVYNQGGVYQNIYATTMGCDSIVITNLTVLPIASSDTHYTLCEGDSVTIGGASYSQAGKYQLNFESASGCDSLVNFSIEVIPNDIESYQIELCPSENFILDLSAYSNHNVDGISEISGGFYSFNEPGTYEYSVFANSCTAIGYVEIQSLPEYNSTIETLKICEGKEIELAVGHTELPYWWSTGDTDSVIYASAAGIYRVNYNHVCGDFSQEYQLISEECNCEVFIPNAFSPDADGVNETWSPSSSCELTFYELSIYNRWGELIFSVDDIEIPFIGGENDYYHKSDVYLYRLKYKFRKDTSNRIRSGHITLLR